ncbi:hypothetical protein BDY17DRAFT_160678 [Neohortaea acidophila]|uniref:Uncharacterized protein n=1 Tax=Neohortaea acidophila TaxID=245834 RepID=A0A6A6PRD0_9PEZI|nr:uncharacterized protein BDY17DRAFT_160678 [Neohortaea acidophila]KAF2482475.1 hypothetical protein BDY17DRAFT_160678 [Neohortaea acidophila]
MPWEVMCTRARSRSKHKRQIPGAVLEGVGHTLIDEGRHVYHPVRRRVVGREWIHSRRSHLLRKAWCRCGVIFVFCGCKSRIMIRYGVYLGGRDIHDWTRAVLCRGEGRVGNRDVQLGALAHESSVLWSGSASRQSHLLMLQVRDMATDGFAQIACLGLGRMAEGEELQRQRVFLIARLDAVISRAG